MAENLKLDAEAFPTLADWLRQPSNDFRERLDYLAAQVRREPAPAVQKGFVVKRELRLIDGSSGGKWLDSAGMVFSLKPGDIIVAPGVWRGPVYQGLNIFFARSNCCSACCSSCSI